MLNLYPWGLSMNLILPKGLRKTEVQFHIYLLPGYDQSDFQNATIHQTELEDEAIVENVQKGVTSRFYRGGRFSVKYESGVHHFQRLLVNCLP